jgi:hypothetical protein
MRARVKVDHRDYSVRVATRVRRVEDVGRTDITDYIADQIRINILTGPGLLHHVLIPGGGIIDTGTMLASVKAMDGHVSVGQPGAPYAVFVDRGTYKMQGRPFFNSAVMDGRAACGSLMSASWAKVFGLGGGGGGRFLGEFTP